MDDDFNSEINSLIKEFFEHVNEGKKHYFSADDLVMLIEYFIDNNLTEYSHKALELALSLYPDNEPVISKKAEMLLLNNKPKKAMEALSEIEHLQEASTFGMLGECSLRLNQTKKAVMYFDRHIELCDAEELLSAYASVANIFNEHDRFGIALDYANRGLEIFKDNNSELLIEKAYASAHSGRYDEAKDLYNLLLDNDPYDVDVWNNLAATYDRTGNQTEALRCFEYIAAIQPNNETERQKALCHIRLGNLQTATDILKRLCNLRPEDYDTKLLLAQTYSANDQPDEAMPIYRELTEAYPLFPEAFTGYARCLYQLTDNCKEAIRILKSADRLFPDNAGIMYDLARLEIGMVRSNYSRRMYLSGMKRLKRCTEIEPDNPEFHNLLALGYIQDDKFEEALHHFTAALECSETVQDLPNIYLNLTLTSWCTGNMDLFEKYYTEARRRYSNTDELLSQILPEAAKYIKKREL